MDLGLNGKTAVILAASKGLGKATALALAAEGCNIAICARGQEALDAAAFEIKQSTGKDPLARALDVTDPAARDAFLDEVTKRFGGIDVLVFNNGGPPVGTGLELGADAWRAAAESTLLAAIDWTKAVAPGMIEKKWGRILLIESFSVKQPVDRLILSNTMRAGVTGFAKTISRELGPHNVLINVLCPGLYATDRLRNNIAKRAEADGIPEEEAWSRQTAEVPLGRTGKPEEFASVVTFFASEKASYLTGTTLQVDGGMIRSLL